MESYSQVNAARLARMVEISRILNSTTNLDDLLTYIIREAADLTGAEAASILLLDPRTRQLYFKAASNEILLPMVETPVPLDSSIAGAILRANKPMIIEDVSRDPRWNRDIDRAIQFHTRSILGVPMRNVDRHCVGVLEAINKLGGSFSQEDVETLAILADLAGVAVEKARLIQELQRANAELNELDQLKTNFIAVASHELRTPLSIILGYISFLREEADSKMAQQLDHVLQAAVHLRSLIQDMLNLRYVDAGDTSLKRTSVDFVELVHNLALDRDETAAAKQQHITVSLPGAALPVLVDPSMIEVTLTNLLNNAVKFTPQAGQINIVVERRGDELWFSISDDGIGVPEDKLEWIFRRFYQVESPLRRHHEGMGLGLAIARELIELHQGRIWAENRPKGTRFTIALALANDYND